MTLTEMGKAAKLASRKLAVAGTETKNKALKAIAESFIKNTSRILSANQMDIENGRVAGLKESMLDRLMLNEARVRDIAAAVNEIAMAGDPIGKILDGFTRPNGLKIHKVRVPMGVIGIIYEARPNVTADAAALCIKSGNAVILRGGKEAIHSNRAFAELMREALETVGLPADCISLVSDTSRESAKELMRLNEYLDLLIPRGGQGLIKSVVENATVPVVETGTGNCHVYIDRSANLDMAVSILYNAKTSRVSVCNACESLVVHKDIAADFLPLAAKKLKEKNVEIRGCEKTVAILGDLAVPASESDYATEFLDYILSVRVVSDIAEAIDHISKYTTGHSEAIITTDLNAARQFTDEVDAAAVYVNASTRFTDGGEFGYGAEIGISTQKLHVRGPMGLEALTSFKYIIEGTGQIR